MQIDFATVADLDAMAGLLGELFILESDFAADRAKQLAALAFYAKLGFEESALVVRRRKL